MGNTKKTDKTMSTEEALRKEMTALRRRMLMTRFGYPVLLIGATVAYIFLSDRHVRSSVIKNTTDVLEKKRYPAFLSLYNTVCDEAQKQTRQEENSNIDPMTLPAIRIAETYSKNNCSGSDDGICNDMNQLLNAGNDFMVTYRVYNKILRERNLKEQLALTPDEQLRVVTTTMALCVAKNGHMLSTTQGEAAVLKMITVAKPIQECNFDVFGRSLQRRDIVETLSQWSSLRKATYSKLITDYITS